MASRGGGRPADGGRNELRGRLRAHREPGATRAERLLSRTISAHADLVPAKRKLAKTDPRGSRGRRFETEPGESCQMDWGFVRVEGWDGGDFKIACFAMVCHHCGTCYVEFFPNARQENLFIGMVHAFMVMGVPEYVLTDNMRSVTTGARHRGKPIWQVDYAAFMACVGFRTRLCKAVPSVHEGQGREAGLLCQAQLRGRAQVLQRHRLERPGTSSGAPGSPRATAGPWTASPPRSTLRSACPPRRRSRGPRSSRCICAPGAASASTGS